MEYNIHIQILSNLIFECIIYSFEFYVFKRIIFSIKYIKMLQISIIMISYLNLYLLTYGWVALVI